MAMKDRMHTGALYLPGDDEIMDRQRLCLDRLYEFNHTRPSETDKRQALMKEMFAVGMALSDTLQKGSDNELVKALIEDMKARSTTPQRPEGIDSP